MGAHLRVGPAPATPSGRDGAVPGPAAGVAGPAPQPVLAPPVVTWWRHAQVLAHLDVDPKTLKARMSESPEHLARPWINIGSARRPDYRWVAQFIDSWWIGVHEWRRSNDGTMPGASAGAIPMALRAAAGARPAGPPRISSARSRRRSPVDGDGSLATLVRRLISG